MSSDNQIGLRELIEKLKEVDSKKFKKSYSKGFKERENYAKAVIKKIVPFGAEAVAPLIEVLRKYDSWACIFAAMALGEIKDETAVKPLISAAEVNEADFLNEEAMFALTKIGKKAIPYLISRINQLIDKPEKDEFWEEITFIFTLGALAEIKDGEVLNFLISLSQREDFISDADNAITLALEMGDQKDTRLIPYLLDIIKRHKGNEYVLREAKSSIRVIEDNSKPEYSDLKNKLKHLSSKEILEKGLEFEEKNELELARASYNHLLELDDKDYHALFCLARLERKEGIPKMFNLSLAINEAKMQNASNEVLELMEEEQKIQESLKKN